MSSIFDCKGEDCTSQHQSSLELHSIAVSTVHHLHSVTKNCPPCLIIHAHLWQFLPLHLHTQPEDVLTTNVHHLVGL